jgi:hypothetical protein
MIPNGIEYMHIESAIQEIDNNEIPKNRKSIHYDYLHNNKPYPPKYVIFLASKYAFGNTFDNFTAVMAKDYLKKRGYIVLDRRENSSGKYSLLADYFNQLTGNSVTLSFQDIEMILGNSLPASARKYVAWWANSKSNDSHPWAQIWIKSGWKVNQLNLRESEVEFSRINSLKLTNHDKFDIVFSNVILRKFESKLIGCPLTVKEIKAILEKVSKTHPELEIADGSIIPKDHAIGNKSPCSCSGTNEQLFHTVSDTANFKQDMFLPCSNNGTSQAARRFFNTYNLKSIVLHESNKYQVGEEREVMTKTRIGQSLFRKNLHTYWEGCSVTGCLLFSVLKASHIKPWKDSNPQEKVDPNNGLLLSPNLDSLFDGGFISFNSRGDILISPLLSNEDLGTLNINNKMALRKITPEIVNYLKYHHKNIFQDKL